MVKNKKKPKLLTKPSQLITATNIEDNDTNFKISFTELDLKNKKFSISEIKDNRIKSQHYDDFLNKINEYSKITEFKKYINSNHWYRNTNHIHPIDWNDNRIRESCFTSLNKNKMEQIKDECWQLGINQTFRIHGYFIENTFYIIWLDPNHNLYERK